VSLRVNTHHSDQLGSSYSRSLPVTFRREGTPCLSRPRETVDRSGTSLPLMDEIDPFYDFVYSGRERNSGCPSRCPDAPRDPATAPHGCGVLVVDDSGDRKDGVKAAHVGHQYLHRYGMARPTTAWSLSPRCGPMSGCTTRCTRCPIPRHGTSRRARTTRRSALARAASIGSIMTDCHGSTWRHRDGLKRYRFKWAPRRSAWFGTEPDQADIRILMIKLGPVQAVPMGPPLAALTSGRSGLR
jgi:hypothetical protein